MSALLVTDGLPRRIFRPSTRLRWPRSPLFIHRGKWNPQTHAVSVCSYPYDHARHVIAAAKAGKHLIIEKPLCLSLKELRSMQKAVQQSGVKTCVCFECRYSSQ